MANGWDLLEVFGGIAVVMFVFYICLRIYTRNED